MINHSQGQHPAKTIYLKVPPLAQVFAAHEVREIFIFRNSVRFHSDSSLIARSSKQADAKVKGYVCLTDFRSLAFRRSLGQYLVKDLFYLCGWRGMIIYYYGWAVVPDLVHTTALPSYSCRTTK